MKRALAVLVLALLGCSNAPRYQVSTSGDGVVTRIDTRTGKSDVLVKIGGSLEWKPVQERASDDGRPATKTDCSTIDPKNPYRDILGC
jgi:hypothetical protein